MQVATRFVKCRSWLVKMTVPLYSSKRLGQRLDGIDVEMVARLVENQHVVVAQQQPRQAEPGALAAGEHRDRLLDVRAAEQQARRRRRESPDPSCRRRPAARVSSTVCFSGRLV